MSKRMQTWEWRGCGSSDPGITVKPMMGERASQATAHGCSPGLQLSYWLSNMSRERST